VQTPKQDPLSFSKMAGGGNDFVVIDHRSPRIEDAADLARRICTRAVSVGGDGLILVESSARATFRMRYYNSDGSHGAFCANGTRCAARFAFLNVIAGRHMTIETDSGIVGADIGEGGLVTLSLPAPHSFRAQRPLVIGAQTVRGSSLMVGVPHYVVFLRGDLWAQNIDPLGSAIRKHPDLAPDGGANVNFVVVRDEHTIEVRTWERGVEGETLSCGSGVVASAVTSALFGKVKPPVAVRTRSGITLEVSFEVRHSSGFATAIESGHVEDVKLKGDARLIYRATITPETLEGFDPDFVRDPAASVTVA
jgi:diaminopimelate epimerase